MADELKIGIRQEELNDDAIAASKVKVDGHEFIVRFFRTDAGTYARVYCLFGQSFEAVSDYKFYPLEVRADGRYGGEEAQRSVAYKAIICAAEKSKDLHPELRIQAFKGAEALRINYAEIVASVKDHSLA